MSRKDTKNKHPYPQHSQSATLPRCPQCGEQIGVWIDCKCPTRKETTVQYTCAHCRQAITDKTWHAYIAEHGDDIERVHHACEQAYEAARDQRAARPQLLPASAARTRRPEPTPDRIEMHT